MRTGHVAIVNNKTSFKPPQFCLHSTENRFNSARGFALNKYKIIKKMSKITGTKVVSLHLVSKSVSGMLGSTYKQVLLMSRNSVRDEHGAMVSYPRRCSSRTQSTCSHTPALRRYVAAPQVLRSHECKAGDLCFVVPSELRAHEISPGDRTRCWNLLDCARGLALLGLLVVFRFLRRRICDNFMEFLHLLYWCRSSTHHRLQRGAVNSNRRAALARFPPCETRFTAQHSRQLKCCRLQFAYSQSCSWFPNCRVSWKTKKPPFLTASRCSTNPQTLVELDGKEPSQIHKKVLYKEKKLKQAIA